MKRLFTILPLLLFVVFSYAQERTCAAVEYLELQQQLDPERKTRMNAIEEHTRRFVQKYDPAKRVAQITIPVVVHVVYRNSSQNLSDARILSQIQVLNEDFQMLNADADGYWPQAADAQIAFCLATVDPNGDPTNGIQRRSTKKRSFSYSNDGVKFYSSGGLDAWPADDYLNIWVCNLGNNLLGYAQFPGGPAATDGVVIDYAYFGTNATSPYDLGRTATHEVGHWLNLRHIWGDGPCGVDDFVADTPESDASNGGCPIGHVSCGTEDMVQNFMDYTYDACMNLFTAGQAARMNAVLAPGGARYSLQSSNGCGDPVDPCPDCNNGVMDCNETGVDCGGPDCDPCDPDPCPDCNNGVMDCNETGVDCGGPDCGPCDPVGTCDHPSNITVTILSARKARISWDAVASASSYELRYRKVGNANWTVKTINNGTSQTLNGLKAGTTYEYQVRSNCSGTYSDWSPLAQFVAGSSGARQSPSEVMLYPNPATDFVTIEGLNIDEKSSISLYDINGKRILQAELNAGSSRLKLDLNTGLYFVHIIQAEQVYVTKLLVQ